MSDETQRLLDLLSSQHDFPGPYSFKVIYRNQPGLGDAILAAVKQETGHAPVDVPDLRSSSGARFVSMTFSMQLEQAEEVLRVYAALGKLDNVLSYF